MLQLDESILKKFQKFNILKISDFIPMQQKIAETLLNQNGIVMCNLIFTFLKNLMLFISIFPIDPKLCLENTFTVI